MDTSSTLEQGSVVKEEGLICGYLAQRLMGLGAKGTKV